MSGTIKVIQYCISGPTEGYGSYGKSLPRKKSN